jgi:hypothetical protein
MCTVLLPPGVNPIAVNIYIYLYLSKCRSTLLNIPEERNSHLDRGGSLKSRIVALSALSGIHATSSEGFLFVFGATAPRGPGPPYARGF